MAFTGTDLPGLAEIATGLGERTGTPATVIQPRVIRLNNPNQMCFGCIEALQEGHRYLVAGAETCRRRGDFNQAVRPYQGENQVAFEEYWFGQVTLRAA